MLLKKWGEQKNRDCVSSRDVSYKVQGVRRRAGCWGRTLQVEWAAGTVPLARAAWEGAREMGGEGVGRGAAPDRDCGPR